MINPFNIHKNKRYILDDRTVVIEDVQQSNVIWYELSTWWRDQINRPILHNTPIFWFALKAQKYKLS